MSEERLDDMLLICERNGGRRFIMTKKDQLIEYNIQDIIEYIVDDQQIEYDETMHIFLQFADF